MLHQLEIHLGCTQILASDHLSVGRGHFNEYLGLQNVFSSTFVCQCFMGRATFGMSTDFGQWSHIGQQSMVTFFYILNKSRNVPKWSSSGQSTIYKCLFFLHSLADCSRTWSQCFVRSSSII